MGSIRISAFALCAALALLLGASAAADASSCGSFQTDLIAGQNDVIGNVTVVTNGDNIVVTYNVTDADWGLTKTHLYVGIRAPKKAAPGKFPYKHEGLADVQTDSYTIALADIAGYEAGDKLIIAAHADARCEDGNGVASLADFCAALPSGTVAMTATRGALWTQYSYIGAILAQAGLDFDGYYDGWCIDTDRGIGTDTVYDTEMICTYDPAFASVVEQPENADLVNYILNQGYVGQASSAGGLFTYSDVQRALWHFLDDENSTAGLGDWSPARVEEIKADVLTNGEGFEPTCGDLVGVALNPVGVDGTTIAQVLLIGVPLDCVPVYCDETAWGYGSRQFRTGWGWTFEYCP